MNLKALATTRAMVSRSFMISKLRIINGCINVYTRDHLNPYQFQGVASLLR